MEGLACLQEQGFDPIDAVPDASPLSESLTHGPDDDPREPLFTSWPRLSRFRLARQQQEMRQIYAALHRAAPPLPLDVERSFIPYEEFVR